MEVWRLNGLPFDLVAGSTPKLPLLKKTKKSDPTRKKEPNVDRSTKSIKQKMKNSLRM